MRDDLPGARPGRSFRWSRAAGSPATPATRGGRVAYFTSISSTSKTRVALGGISRPAPRAP